MHKHLVIGTAGHIDHGKSTLVKALTSIDPDRLEEEKKRGITIVLGYAHMRIGDEDISFIDVPGHERFVKTMMSGATGLDAVMLVVAADEGIMPQTREHFAITKHLAVQTGFIVITKTDRASFEQVSALENALHKLVDDSYLAGKPIFRTAIDDPQSFMQIRDYLQLLLSPISSIKADMPPRIYIDRVFTLKGKGTVVTGTLMEGTLQRGTVVYTYPSGAEMRIKQLQIHGEEVVEAFYGHRVAINVSSDLNAVNRGDLLTTLSNREGQYILDAEIQFDLSVRHWERIRFFHGTREIMGRIVLTNQRPVESGNRAIVQLRLEEAVYANVGDHFIIRRFSPIETLGGGTITKVNAKKHQLSSRVLLSEEMFLMELLKDQQQPFDLGHDVFKSISMSASALQNELQSAVDKGFLRMVSDNLYMTAQSYEDKRDAVYHFIENYQETHPYRLGINRAELKSKCFSDFSKQVFDRILQMMLEDRVLKITAPFIHTYDFTPVEDAAYFKISAAFEKLFDADPIRMANSADVKALSSRSAANMDIFTYLKYREFIVKINEERYMLKDAYIKAKKALLGYFETHEMIDVASYRDLLATSRKNSVMLLEHFDEIGLTKRIENIRVLNK